MDLILLFKAFVMGLVEGATEFIPVSSSGHLIIVGDWLNFLPDRPRTRNTFEIVIQLGAILAVVWLYRSKIASVLRGLFRREPVATRLALNLIIASIPAAVLGLLLDDWIQANLFRPITVAVALIVGGVIILLIEAWHRPVHTDDLDAIRPRDALGVGLAQLLSLIPGTSRSASTILGGVALGLSRVAATEFSFFLAIPIMFGASGLSLFKARESLTSGDVPLFAVGFVFSFLSALVVIRFLVRFVARHDFRGFAIYRILFGAVLLAWYALGPG